MKVCVNYCCTCLNLDDSQEQVRHDTLRNPLIQPISNFSEEYKMEHSLQDKECLHYTIKEIKEEIVVDGINYIFGEENEQLERFFESLTDSVSKNKEPLLSILMFTEVFSTSNSNYIWANIGKAIANYGTNISLVDFRSFVVTMTRTPPHHGMKLFWDASQCNGDILQEDRIRALLLTLLEVSRYDPTRIVRLRNDLFASLWRHMCKSTESLERNSFNLFLEWVDITIPCVCDALHSFVKEKVFRGSAYESSYHPVILKQDVDSKNNNGIQGSKIINDADTAALALHTVGAQGSWKQLYCSGLHGKSLAVLGTCIMGYDAPTVLLIRCETVVFGAYNETAWREGNRMYGNSSSFLFVLKPHLKLFDCLGTSYQNFQFFNIQNKDFPIGLGMGGIIGKFRFFVNGMPVKCCTTDVCETYEPGILLPPDTDGWEEDFIDAMEVWGTGGEKCIQNGLLAQEKFRSEEKDKAALAIINNTRGGGQNSSY